MAQKKSSTRRKTTKSKATSKKAPAKKKMTPKHRTTATKGKVKAAPKKAAARKRKTASKSKAKKATTRKVAASAPKPGTTITREFKGAEHVVTVTADGFEYRGKPFTSLTAVAKAITGYAAISGPRFFGTDAASKKAAS